MVAWTLDALLGALSVEIEAFSICEIGEDVRLMISNFGVPSPLKPA